MSEPDFRAIHVETRCDQMQKSRRCVYDKLAQIAPTIMFCIEVTSTGLMLNKTGAYLAGLFDKKSEASDHRRDSRFDCSGQRQSTARRSLR
ncbi:hypothetical protein O9929_24290 [Vibrio lentus]|nr:hypothetical protein [Vibrio lentus]